jgi:hypothetical protein
MANRLEVHFVDGTMLVIEHELGALGVSNQGPNGMIEAKEPGRELRVAINRENITFVRDYGPVTPQTR